MKPTMLVAGTLLVLANLSTARGGLHGEVE